MNELQRAQLLELLHEPTAPFRETHVVHFAERVLRAGRVPFFRDGCGNLVVGVGSATGYRRLLARRDTEPLRLFVAHMDHPGFHGLRWLSSTRLRASWHGGGPRQGLTGAALWLADDAGYAALGRVQRATFDRKRTRLLALDIDIERSARPVRPPATALFGGLRDRAPAWREGKLIYTKAADDLVGVFAVLQTALTVRHRAGAPFIGLLTRAEEVGFVGMVAHLEQGWLQRARRPVVCISLETSRTLPGAEIGKGPVVRFGDRRTVFNPGYLRVLTDVATRVLPGKHQRRIMDGGACEATAALAYGVRAIGISVPLGNYHNESFEPRTRGKPAPEFVHLDDVNGLLTLCRALLRPGLRWSDPWHETRKALGRRLERQRRLLTP